MSGMDRVLLILACTLAFLLIASLGAVVFSERFMTGGTGPLTVILGTASTVLTAVAGGAYFARDVKRASEEENTGATREAAQGGNSNTKQREGNA